MGCKLADKDLKCEGTASGGGHDRPETCADTEDEPQQTVSDARDMVRFQITRVQ